MNLLDADTPATAPDDAAPPAERERAVTLSRKALRREARAEPPDPELDHWAAVAEAARPRTRADCVNGPRPCLFVSCKHHLYLDVNPQTGSLKLNFPGKELWELEETCALDAADRGGMTLEQVAAAINLTRERIRQVETRGLAHMRAGVDDVDGDPPARPAADPGPSSPGGATMRVSSRRGSGIPEDSPIWRRSDVDTPIAESTRDTRASAMVEQLRRRLADAKKQPAPAEATPPVSSFAVEKEEAPEVARAEVAAPQADERGPGPVQQVEPEVVHPVTPPAPPAEERTMAKREPKECCGSKGPRCRSGCDGAPKRAAVAKPADADDEGRRMPPEARIDGEIVQASDHLPDLGDLQLDSLLVLRQLVNEELTRRRDEAREQATKISRALGAAEAA